MVLTTILRWGWSPILITALAIIGYLYEWPVEVLTLTLVCILLIGLLAAVISAREKRLELSSIKFRQLVGYFNRRFMGDSSISIFMIIDSLFNVDDPKLWDWARACDMAKRIFNTWCASFMGRVEGDIKTHRFDIYLPIYLNELWLMNIHYYEFVTQFYEIAKSVEMPREIIEQYNRFATEYNAFIQDFRESISELGKVARTRIEPPSLLMAPTLAEVR